MNNCKLYIAVLDQVPDNMVPVLVAHATLRHHLQWGNATSTRYNKWLTESFRKCVVKVNQKEFDKISNLHEKGYETTGSWENTTLCAKISCVTILVDETIPNVLKFAKLWTPTQL